MPIQQPWNSLPFRAAMPTAAERLAALISRGLSQFLCQQKWDCPL
jgi:hypothetical protein